MASLAAVALDKVRVMAARANVTKMPGCIQMNPEPHNIMEAFVSGRDAFGILLIGFGKCLYFA